MSLRNRLRRFAGIALLATLLGAGSASACPMCKAGNEAGGATSSAEQQAADSRAKAYMYSIFFMMGMPPLVLGGFALAVRREMRRAAAEAETRGSIA